MTRHLQCEEQQESPSNISKDCACQEIPSSRFEPKIRELIPPIERWFEDNPRIIRAWSDHEIVISHPPLRDLEHAAWKNTNISHSSWLPKPNAAPAMKSDAPTSPNVAPATKNHLRHIWNVQYSARATGTTFQHHQNQGNFLTGNAQVIVRCAWIDPTLLQYHHAKWISVYPNWETMGSLLFCLLAIPEISASRWWEVWMSEWDSPVCVLSAAWRLSNHLSRVKRRPRRLQKTPFWRIWIWGTTASVMKGPRLGVCSGWGREIYRWTFLRGFNLALGLGYMGMVEAGMAACATLALHERPCDLAVWSRSCETLSNVTAVLRYTIRQARHADQMNESQTQWWLKWDCVFKIWNLKIWFYWKNTKWN